jgi:hypothetical protein
MQPRQGDGARRWAPPGSDAATGDISEIAESDAVSVPTERLRDLVRPRAPLVPARVPATHDSRAVSPSAAPTIRVTIGRVEIQALLPPAPPDVARAWEPRMSLDEYLRARSEARR